MSRSSFQSSVTLAVLWLHHSDLVVHSQVFQGGLLECNPPETMSKQDKREHMFRQGRKKCIIATK